MNTLFAQIPAGPPPKKIKGKTTKAVKLFCSCKESESLSFVENADYKFIEDLIREANFAEWKEAAETKGIGLNLSNIDFKLWAEMSGSAYELMVPALLQRKGLLVQRHSKTKAFGDLCAGESRLELKTGFTSYSWDSKTFDQLYNSLSGEAPLIDMPLVLIVKDRKKIGRLTSVESGPLWSFLGSSREYPLNVHRKNGQWNNVRPVSKRRRFQSREEIVSALTAMEEVIHKKF